MAKRKTPEEEAALAQEIADKHNVSEAQVNNLVDEAQTRGVERRKALQQINSASSLDEYAKKLGYPNAEVLKEAESAREKASTNDRLLNSSERTARIGALKDMAATAASVPGGEKHAKAALDALAKEAGVTIPADQPTPQQQAMDKVRASKGLPPLNPTPSATPTTPAPTVAPATKPGSESLYKTLDSLVKPPTPSLPVRGGLETYGEYNPQAGDTHLGTDGSFISGSSRTLAPGELAKPSFSIGGKDVTADYLPGGKFSSQSVGEDKGLDPSYAAQMHRANGNVAAADAYDKLAGVHAALNNPAPKAETMASPNQLVTPGNTLPPSPAPVANPVGYGPPPVNAAAPAAPSPVAPAPVGAVPGVDNSPFSLHNAGLGWLQNLIDTGKSATPNPDDRRAKLAALGVTRAY